ncbi:MULTISPECIES: outer membrane protein assembly factor BamE [Francisella]|uniref:Outer membrane protein assembly factor BamE n=1 Tax=Francisella opportunistica TaxID=2016517 RepID=A0A345JTM9_9GAMM|nr:MULTISPECIES: outer membrane protein assembly factor BamE [Francisella]APC90811.1 Outer membrane lipoprotein [Francisella sp. MA067296]AXH30675.1 outer membrane protein assembly factor BamE [Francisella opportunistica]AXH32316.1 outer membrane protein assembly factor BamE [Francisella opportunistica]AXH33965.1 outer membrane protein assembly factor BamE [Francisella opportunistica]
MFKLITKNLSVLIAILSLSACGVIEPYTAPVPQGKQIKDKKLFEVKPNMTKGEVTYILGSPDIIDTFNPNQYIYINTYKKSMQDTQFSESKLILTFNNQDRLVGISGNYAPPTKDPVF